MNLENYTRIDKAMLVAMSVVSASSAWALWMVLNQKDQKEKTR
jgi:hypothetical protein